MRHRDYYYHQHKKITPTSKNEAVFKPCTIPHSSLLQGSARSAELCVVVAMRRATSLVSLILAHLSVNTPPTSERAVISKCIDPLFLMALLKYSARSWLPTCPSAAFRGLNRRQCGCSPMAKSPVNTSPQLKRVQQYIFLLLNNINRKAGDRFRLCRKSTLQRINK